MADREPAIEDILGKVGPKAFETEGFEEPSKPSPDPVKFKDVVHSSTTTPREESLDLSRRNYNRSAAPRLGLKLRKKS